MKRIGVAVGMVVAAWFAATPCWGQEQPQRPKILGIAGVRIRVTSFCDSDWFYAQVTGQKTRCVVAGGAQPDQGTRGLWSGQQLELNNHSLYGPEPDTKNRVEEVAFVVDSAVRMTSYLEAKGIKTSKATYPVRVAGIMVIDPEGHRIEFVEDELRDEASRPDVKGIQRSRIIHAGWVVKDREAMDKFYKDVLGFHLYWQGGMKDERVDWVSMQVPDGTDWIEYMLNIPPDANKHLLGVMNHIALGVPSVQAAAEQLKKNGVKLTEEPKIGRDGKWQLNLYDPDDTRVELMEFTPVEKPCCAEFTGTHPKP